MEFGIKPEKPKSICWGARAIFERENRLNPHSPLRIDVVWDRQQIEGGSETERQAFAKWLEKVGLPRLRKLVKTEGLSPHERREIRHEVDGYVIRADPKQSHGYLYIGIYPIADAPPLKLSLYGAWPLVPSSVHPRELTIQCPFCKSIDIALTGEPGPIGTGPEGRWRMGDPGGRELALCNGCGKKGYLVIQTKFSLGNVVITPAAEAALVGEEQLIVNTLLERHVIGDWGEVEDEDKQANEAALVDGARLLSVYKVSGKTIWIITEADRSVTTVLLPDDN